MSVSYTHLDVYKRQVFKQIKVLTSNDDYTIVEAKTPYGISLYDHIALDLSLIHIWLFPISELNFHS